MSNNSRFSRGQKQQEQQQPLRSTTYSRQQQQQQQQSGLRPPTVQIQTYEEIEFARPDPASSYRVTVNTMEGDPYVGISNWWFNRSQGTWCPSKKQVFLPKAAWFGLMEASEQISAVIEPLEGSSDMEFFSCLFLIFNLKCQNNFQTRIK